MDTPQNAKPRYYTTTVWWNDIDGPNVIGKRNLCLQELGIEIIAGFLLKWDANERSTVFLPRMYWVSEDTEMFGQLNPWWFFKITYELYFANGNNFWYLDRLRELYNFFKAEMPWEIEVTIMKWVVNRIDDLNSVQYDIDSVDDPSCGPGQQKHSDLCKEREKLTNHFVDNFMRVYKTLSENWRNPLWENTYPRLKPNGCQSEEPGTDKAED